MSSQLGKLSKKKYGIIWEFFPNGELAQSEKSSCYSTKEEGAGRRSLVTGLAAAMEGYFFMELPMCVN